MLGFNSISEYPISDALLPYPQTVAVGVDLTGNLISQWKLADVSDSIGANTLTNNNVVTFVAGKIGNCASFVGASSQSLSVADTPTLDVGIGDFGISLWVKSSTTADMQFLSKGDGGAIGYWLGLTVSGSFLAVATDGTDTVSVGSPAGFADGLWHHVLANFDRDGNLQLFIDGSSVGTSALSAVGNLDNTSPFYLGRVDDGVFPQYFTGQLDAVYFRKALFSESDRTVLYNAGAGTETTVDTTGVSSAAATAVAPTLTAVKTLTPDAISVQSSAVAPTVIPGAVSVVPPAASAQSSVVASTLTPGTSTIVPPVASAQSSVVAPTVTPGASTVTPPVASAQSSVVAPTVSLGAVSIVPPAVTATSSAVAPTLTAGAVTIVPGVALAISSIIDPVLIAGAPPYDLIPFVLYIDRGRDFEGFIDRALDLTQYIDRGRDWELYVDQARDQTLYIEQAREFALER